MATYIGKSGVVKVGGTAVAEVKDWSIETTSEMVTTTTMGDDWVGNKATQKSWSASFNAFWDKSDSAQTSLVEGASITLELQPEGDTTGLSEFSGSCIVASVSRSASFDGLVEASFSVTGDGALTVGTVSA